MEVIQQFAENETYLYALRQQFQVQVPLSVQDVAKSEIAAARLTETLEAVLREPLGIVFFNQFLRTIKCIDMTLFLGEVMQFEELPNGAYRWQVCKKIVQKYLQKESRLSVTVAEPIRRLILSKLERRSDDEDIFASAKRNVQRDLLMDAFPEFLYSHYYSRLLSFRAKETMTVSRRDFEFIRVLGKGGFGKVYAARKLDTRQMYACKEMSKERVIERKRERLLQNEVGISHFLTRVSHPFIVGLHYAFQNHTNLYFVMDLVTGGELEYHLHNKGRFALSWVRFYAAGIVLALSHLHSQSIVYRDLKLENVLLDSDGYVRLADLGLCATLPDGQQLYEHCGTRSFMAPEQCMAGYRFEVDWWALGVCIYKMLTNKNPFTKIWREQEKPKEGLVSSILTRSIRQLTSIKTSISRREVRTTIKTPIGGEGGEAAAGPDTPISPMNVKAALPDTEKKKHIDTMRRRKTTLLRGMFESAIRDMVWPENIDEHAKSFVLATLQMDSNVRLGHNGADEIKNHEFFKGFDWNRLERKHMVTPFIPSNGSVNAEYVEAADNPSSKKRYPVFADFDYVARTTFQQEVMNTMHDFEDLIAYRKHPPPTKLV